MGHQPRGCESCGFGFLFELLDDYYPSPKTALIVCDQQGAVIALGHAATAVTGFREVDVLGHDVSRALSLQFDDGIDHIERSLEWGVRAGGVLGAFTPRGLGAPRPSVLDIFPAYDDDGGLMVALTPR